MTREQLITENTALHGLLAQACQALANVANAASQPLVVSQIARDTLCQVMEGWQEPRSPG